MKRLAIWILNLLTVVAALAAILAAILAYDGQSSVLTGLARSILFGSILLMFAVLFSNWRDKIRRTMPPRHWSQPKAPRKEKPRPTPEPVSKPAPVATQLPQERRLAPPPMAEAVDFIPAPVISVMPDRMLRFVANGDKAINLPQEPTVPVDRHQRGDGR